MRLSRLQHGPRGRHHVRLTRLPRTPHGRGQISATHRDCIQARLDCEDRRGIRDTQRAFNQTDQHEFIVLQRGVSHEIATSRAKACSPCLRARSSLA